MDVVYTFGHSVDVDGDEWIDLGPMPAPCDARAASQDVALSDNDENNYPFSAQIAPKVQANASEPIQEPELQQLAFKGQRQQNVKVTGPSKSTPEAVVASKATRSKEALMAFYLGRAKQMEAKHKKIVVSSTKPMAIRSLQESQCSARIGI